MRAAIRESIAVSRDSVTIWRSRYHTDGATTSWLKIKNPTYSQAEARHELFARRRPVDRHVPTPRRLNPAARPISLQQRQGVTDR